MKNAGTIKLFIKNKLFQELTYSYLYQRHGIIERWQCGNLFPGTYIQICPEIDVDDFNEDVIGRKPRKKKVDPEMEAKYIRPSYHIHKSTMRYTGYK